MTEDKKLEQELAEWRTHYKAMSESCDGLAKLVTQLQENIALLQAEKKQWLVKEATMQSIIQQEINRVNAQSQLYLEENQQLKAEIVKLRG
jgi:phage shock protein A